MPAMSSNSMISSSSNNNATSTSSRSSRASSGASSGLSMFQEVLAENKASKTRNSYSSTNSTVITETARLEIQRLFITTEQSDTYLRDDVIAK